MLESTDSNYLESLSDEEFFSRRFELSEEDQNELNNNSVVIEGHRYYRATVKDNILRKYAKATNPKPGEPGTRENPLIRFGKEYVYNETGDLVEFVRRNVRFVLRPDMRLTQSQKRMVLLAGQAQINYTSDCPELSDQVLKECMKYGMIRNQKRAEYLMHCNV